LLAAAGALQALYAHLMAAGSSRGWEGTLYPFPDFVRMIGFERVWAFERTHPEEG
jgi:hypothetical protein